MAASMAFAFFCTRPTRAFLARSEFAAMRSEIYLERTAAILATSFPMASFLEALSLSLIAFFSAECFSDRDCSISEERAFHSSRVFVIAVEIRSLASALTFPTESFPNIFSISALSEAFAFSKSSRSFFFESFPSPSAFAPLLAKSISHSGVVVSFARTFACSRSVKLETPSSLPASFNAP